MALNADDLAAALKATTKEKLQATLPEGTTLQDSASIDAFYLGVATAIVEYLVANVEVFPGSMTAGGDAVTGTGIIA